MKSTRKAGSQLLDKLRAPEYLAGIISGIAVAVGVAMILGIGDFVLRLTTPTLKAIGQLLIALAQPIVKILGYRLPLWLLILLVVIGIPGFLALQKAIRRSQEDEATRQDRILEDYRSDIYNDLKLRWTWGSNIRNGEPELVTLSTYCPECDYELDIRSTDRSIQCDNFLCNFSTNFPFEWGDYRPMVFREIERRMRQRLGR